LLDFSFEALLTIYQGC